MSSDGCALKGSMTTFTDYLMPKKDGATRVADVRALKDAEPVATDLRTASDLAAK